MMRSPWLFLTGLLLAAPLVLMLWLGSFDQFTSPDLTIGWRSGDGGGRLGSGATTGFDIYMSTLLFSVAWVSGLVHVLKMFAERNVRGKKTK